MVFFGDGRLVYKGIEDKYKYMSVLAVVAIAVVDLSGEFGVPAYLASRFLGLLTRQLSGQLGVAFGAKAQI